MFLLITIGRSFLFEVCFEVSLHEISKKHLFCRLHINSIADSEVFDPASIYMLKVSIRCKICSKLKYVHVSVVNFQHAIASWGVIQRCSGNFSKFFKKYFKRNSSFTKIAGSLSAAL